MKLFLSVLLAGFPLFAGAEKLKVAVSVLPQAGIVERIGGDHVEVLVLADQGQDPHTFTPSAKRVTEISQAAIWFTSGMPFEQALEEKLAGRKDGPVLVSLGPDALGIESEAEHDDHDHGHGEHHDHEHGKKDDHGHGEHHDHEHGKKDDHGQGEHHDHEHGKKDDHGHGEHHDHEHGKKDDHGHGEHHDHEHGKKDDHEHGEHHDHGHGHGHEGHQCHLHGGSDPHVWLSPLMVGAQGHVVAFALSGQVPELKSDFKKNAEDLELEALDLDEELAAMLAPKKGKKFYVFHPAYGYFASAYGLEQVPIETGGREPSAKHLTQLVEQAKEDQVDVVLVQPQFQQRGASRIAKAIGAELRETDPLGRNALATMRQLAAILAESK